MTTLARTVAVSLCECEWGGGAKKESSRTHGPAWGRWSNHGPSRFTRGPFSTPNDAIMCVTLEEG